MRSDSRGNVEQRVRDCLRAIKDPCSVATGYPLHLEDMGLVKSVDVDLDARRVVVDLRLTSSSCVMVGFFSTELQNLVKEAIPEIRHVEVHFDQGFEWTPDMMSERVRRQRAARFALNGSITEPADR